MNRAQTGKKQRGVKAACAPCYDGFDILKRKRFQQAGKTREACEGEKERKKTTENEIESVETDNQIDKESVNV